MKRKVFIGVLICSLLLLSSALSACSLFGGGETSGGGGIGGGGGDGDVPTHEHTMVEHYGDPATCTEDGIYGYWECTGCGKNYYNESGTDEVADLDDLIIKASHNLHTAVANEPTCTDRGNIAFWECLECHECFTDKDATQSIDKENVWVEALGHDYEYHAAHNDQVYCSIAGWNEYHTCSRCNYTTLAGYYAPHKPAGLGNGKYECSGCHMDLTGTEGLSYTLNSDEQSYTVTGIGTATDTVIVIPSTHEGKSVTAIGRAAFENCRNVTEVVILDGVTTIGERAFYGCKEMENVQIPNSVTKISAYAFYACSKLEHVKIPSGVTKIENNTFNSCTGLTGVEIPSSVTEIGEKAFYFCKVLMHFEFDGTKAEWDAIEKGYDWYPYEEKFYTRLKDYLVYCSDATVTANGDNVVSYRN